MDWNSEKAPMSGLENLEISGEEFVSKILISGIHYPSLGCIKLHYMKNLVNVDLARVNTLRFLDLRNCPKLKGLVATSYLPNVRNPTLVLEIPDLRDLAGQDLIEVHHFNDVSGVSSFKMLTNLNISECPELQKLRLGHLNCLEIITIEKCNHLKSISGIYNLAKLVKLEIWDCENLELEYLCFSGKSCLESIIFQRNGIVKYFELCDCQNLLKIQFDCKELVQLSILACPKVKIFTAFEGLNLLERVIIDACGKLEYLQLYDCQNLRSVSGNSIRRLHITSCPQFEKLQDFSKMSSLEEIEISQCEKIQNIRLPKIVISLSVQKCRILQTVAGTDDLVELKNLTIRQCLELEGLTYLSKKNAMEKIEIYQCGKIQNIRLPTTLITLCAQKCRMLQTVAGIGHLIKLRELTIRECPELVKLSSLSKLSCLEKIVINSCEKLQNKVGIQQLPAVKYMKLVYCSNALIRNSSPKLKRQPSEGMVMIGRAVDGAESRLNENLFHDANIGVDGAGEIGTHRIYPKWSELSEVIVWFVVAVDRNSSVWDTNESLQHYSLFSGYRCPLEVREGEWVITMVGCNYWHLFFPIDEILNVLRRHGILKRGIWAGLKKDKAWKSVQVLSAIIDRLYPS